MSPELNDQEMRVDGTLHTSGSRGGEGVSK